MTAGSPKTWTSGLVSVADMNAEVRDQLSYIFGAWSTDWTPTWTNLTIGNAVVRAFYKRIGATVHVQLRVVFGTTTSIGGSVSVELPVATRVGTGMQFLHCSARDQSTGNYLSGTAEVSENDATLTLRVSGDADPSEAGITSSAPFTWTTSDEIRVYGTYECAPVS